MKDVTLELTAAEALIALGAIQDKQLDASTLAAISTGEEHEIADLSAKMLGRIAVQITDALYPDEMVTICRGGPTADCGNTAWHSSHSADEQAGPWKCSKCGGLGAHTVTGHESIPDHSFLPPETERRIDRVLDAMDYPVDREGDPAFNGAFDRW